VLPAAAAPPAPVRAPAQAPAATLTTTAADTQANRITRIASTTPDRDLSDSQVLRVLEQRVARSPDAPGSVGVDAAEAAGAIELLSPQDTQSWREIRAQLERQAEVYFAVQLEWSVSEIDLARVPELAIFGAYTLYRIEGSRQGRKWYGLRLGFFKDAHSAKQVAFYVRSEFATVAVVPVGANERGNAQQYGAIKLSFGEARGRRDADSRSEEITLIEDRPALPEPKPAAAAPAAPEAKAGSNAAAAPARRPGRPRGMPKSLEETLEILGASQLTIDPGKTETILNGASRPQPDRRTTVFSKLLDRLSEKMKK
jgi:hypothetical protein